MVGLLAESKSLIPYYLRLLTFGVIQRQKVFVVKGRYAWTPSF